MEVDAASTLVEENPLGVKNCEEPVVSDSNDVESKTSRVTEVPEPEVELDLNKSKTSNEAESIEPKSVLDVKEAESKADNDAKVIEPEASVPQINRVSTTDTPMEIEITASSSNSPSTIQEATTRSGNFVKPAVDPASVDKDNSVYELYKSMKTNIKAVEEQAMDFIGEIHHPAISCFRDITRADFNNVLQNLRFTTESNELEQAIICIGLFDYIAVSLKNPLYAENFYKIQVCVHGCVKKLFLELRRIMREWANTDFKGFSKANDLIIKYLRGLESYFTVINFDESYKSALNLLSKEAKRYRKNKTIKNRPNGFEERLALIEIVGSSNTISEGKANESGVDCEKDRDMDDDFQCLDVPLPTKNLLPPAPIFLKKSEILSKGHKKDKTNKINKSAELLKQYCDSSKVTNEVDKNKDENKNTTLKRQSSDSSEDIPRKKFCPTLPETDEKEVSLDDSEIKIVSSSLSSPQKSAPTVNAFMLMMNKSREMAKANKAKKSDVKTPNSKVKVK